MSGFKFDFQLEDQDLDEEYPTHQPEADQSSGDAKQDSDVGGSTSKSRECRHLTLDELLDSLPDTISYSPLPHPTINTSILRRDLFDARFQLMAGSSSSKGKERSISEGPADAEGDEGEEEYVDAATDLIPGLYEGGLKTWEGGLDLIEVLSEGLERDPSWLPGISALEVGCGTALPSAYLLRSLLAATAFSSTTTGHTIFHLQDFNAAVLRLVSFPNLLLAALPFLPAEALRSAESVEDVEDTLPDLEKSGHLSVTSELKEAFKALLSERRIQLKFTYGHWAGLAEELKRQETERYTLLLTSETIYAEESVGDLLDVLKCATTSSKSTPVMGKAAPSTEVELEVTLGSMSVKDSDWVEGIKNGESVILVAAKILYFGVGGGLASFLHRVERDNGWWTGVKEWLKGVGRKVVRIGW